MHIFHLKLEKNHPYYNDNKVIIKTTKQKQQLIEKKDLTKKPVNLQ